LIQKKITKIQKMPCILKIRIVAAWNLPVMDRTTDLTGKLLEF
jgi:hypothetical protein